MVSETTATCCACGRLSHGSTLIDLPHPAPDNALGWACPICSLAQAGAVALICADCRVAGVDIRYALAGPSIDAPARVPVKELDGALIHDWAKHGLVEQASQPIPPVVRRHTVTGDDPDAVAIVPEAIAFEGEHLMEAHHLKAIGDGLIAEHEPLASLARHVLRYLWRVEGRRQDGEPVLGDVSLANPHLRFYTKAEAVVEMAADHCRGLSCLTLEAALFHVLLHLSENDHGRLVRARHDFSGFYQEAHMYGAWRRDLRQAADTFRQLTLAI